MTDREFQKLLNRTSAAAEKHFKLMQECEEAFLNRYGAHYSDIDADGIADVLDLSGGSITVADCDEEMAMRGHPRQPTNEQREGE